MGGYPKTLKSPKNLDIVQMPWQFTFKSNMIGSPNRNIKWKSCTTMPGPGKMV
jgi:hypothetical protein